jgi:superfamily I DNA/RNA helicase/Zn-dependent peptidase ImmA (M78 family)
VSPFSRAREEALALRRELVGDEADGPVSSKVLLGRVESILNLGVQAVAKQNSVLKGGNATLRSHLGFIYYRDDCSWEEQAYLIAHELGHFKLDDNSDDATVHVNSAGVAPATLANAAVEAYGARERDELQKNVFGRELLLPRAVARRMFLSGQGPRAIAKALAIPLEVARQQALDAVLLPSHVPMPPTPLPMPTPDQQAAIDAAERHVHVVAGPGTGKTTTLIHRVKKLIERDNVDPQKILVLTFTNKAAAELVDRLQRSGVTGASRLWAGTFHAFGLEFLRKYYQHFDVEPDVAVADKITQITLVAQALAGAQLEHYRRTDDPYEWLPPVIDVARRLKEELVSVDHYLDEALQHAGDEAQAAIFRDIATVSRAYDAALKQAKTVDFADLVALPALAIANDRAKFADIADGYQHVLVDEFQDLTTAMVELVSQLEKTASSLWVVGDIRQAIYHWRGASLEALLGFSSRFKGAARYDLIVNRRSVQEVIDLTVVAGTEHPLQKDLPLPPPQCARGASGRTPVMERADSRVTMWRGLVDSIRSQSAQGIDLKDQVVVARRGALVAAAAQALEAAGVPTLYVGELLERPEIKDILAVIQVIVERMPRALLRVASLTEPSMGLADVQAILKAVDDDATLQRLAWLRANRPVLTDRSEAARADLREKLSDFAWSTGPWDFICELLLERRFLLVDLADDSVEAHVRRLALWQFAYMARTGDGNGKRSTLHRFLTRARLRQQVRDVYIDRELPQETSSLQGVRVMTVHGSKGLEFRAVHLCAVKAQDFAGGNDINALLPPDCIGSSAAMHERESDIECHNLLYVALSRAKDTVSIYENADEPYFSQVAALTKAVSRKKLATRTLSPTTGTAPTPGPNTAAMQTASLSYEALLTYDRCPRQYLYRFGMEMGRELSPNPSLQARGLVLRTLQSVARSGRFGLVRQTFEQGWHDSRLPECDADAQLWAQAWAACERGAGFLESADGQYALPVAVVKGMTFELPWGIATKAPGGRRIHCIGFYSASRRDRLDKLLGQLMHCTTTTAMPIVEAELFDLSRESSRLVQPISVFDRSLLSTRAGGLRAGAFAPDASGYPCGRCVYSYVCPSLLTA